MPENETAAELAARIAFATSDELQNIIHIKAAYLREPLEMAVRMAVLRAFGCGCTPGRRMSYAMGTERSAAMYFEDMTCALHGIGPVDEPPTRPDPGY